MARTTTRIPNIRTVQTILNGTVYRWEMIVPNDLRRRLGKVKLSETLPKDRTAAVRRAMQLTSEAKALFAVLRNPSTTAQLDAQTLLTAYGIPNRQLTPTELEHLPMQLESKFDRYETVDEMPPNLRAAFETITGRGSKALSVAMKFYVETRSTAIKPAVMQATQRYVNKFIEIIGDLEIDEIKRDHVRSFAQDLSATLNPASIKLALKRIAVVIQHYIVEKDLTGVSVPFAKFYVVDDSGREQEEHRRPYTPHEFLSVLSIQPRFDRPSEHQLLLALHLIATTGARMSEIVCARVGDVKVDRLGQVSLDLFDNDTRTLKTKHSKRTVPIVYSAVAQSVMSAVKDKSNNDAQLFPHWASKTNQFGHSCRRLVDAKVELDTAVNGNRVALHSLRHTVAQALKDVQAPTDVINSLLGWSGRNMASHYGSELALDVKREWLGKALSRLLTSA
jgi:integrase